MKVKEIIELLRQEYQDADFGICDVNGNYYEPLKLICTFDLETKEAFVNVEINIG